MLDGWTIVILIVAVVVLLSLILPRGMRRDAVDERTILLWRRRRQSLEARLENPNDPWLWLWRVRLRVIRYLLSRHDSTNGPSSEQALGDTVDKSITTAAPGRRASSEAPSADGRLTASSASLVSESVSGYADRSAAPKMEWAPPWQRQGRDLDSIFAGIHEANSDAEEERKRQRRDVTGDRIGYAIQVLIHCVCFGALLALGALYTEAGWLVFVDGRWSAHLSMVSIPAFLGFVLALGVWLAAAGLIVTARAISPALIFFALLGPVGLLIMCFWPSRTAEIPGVANGVEPAGSNWGPAVLSLGIGLPVAFAHYYLVWRIAVDWPHSDQMAAMFFLLGWLSWMLHVVALIALADHRKKQPLWWALLAVLGVLGILIVCFVSGREERRRGK